MLAFQAAATTSSTTLPTAASSPASATMSAVASDSAISPHDLYERVKPSLVIVRFTYDGEAGRRDFEGAGIVIDTAGLVVFSSALTPAGLPDEFLKHFKIVLPGDEETELDATFLGRDDRANIAFVRVKETSGHTWTPVKFVDGPKQEVGAPIYSVGLLSKDSGYRSYLAESYVAATLRGPVPQVLVGGGGLTPVGSPVFDAAGNAIGLVEVQSNQTAFYTTDPAHSLDVVTIPPHTFVPSIDFLHELADPPTAGQPIAIPWTGVAQLTGLKKDVAEYYGIKGDPAVQIGDVIADGSAIKAGVKAGDVIVKYDGKPLDRGDSPEETWLILARTIGRLHVGDEITLTLISGKGEAPHDVKLKLQERPMPAARAKRFYAEDLGFSVRNTVFEDTYERRLPTDTPGVMVAFIKPSSSAAAAHLSANRDGQDLITQFNGQTVKNVDDFKEKYEAVRKAKPKEALVLEVMRGTNTEVIRIEPPQ